MRIQSIRTAGSLALAALLQLGSAAAATAFNIQAGDVPAGVSSATVDGVLFESSPRAFAHKSNLGFEGLGVKGGYVDGEIDLAGESITITFASPVVLDELVLGHLFKRGNFGDKVNEVARVQVLGVPDTFIAGDLSVTSGSTATWSGTGGGAVTNLSPGTVQGGGLWSIANPFGDLAVQGIKLYAVQVGKKVGSSSSDFSFVSLTAGTQPVPEPGTALLLGAGLIGLAASGRRRATGSAGRVSGRA